MFSKFLILVMCVFSFSTSYAHHGEDEKPILKPVSNLDANYESSCDDIYFNFYDSVKAIKKSSVLTQFERSNKMAQKSRELTHIDRVCFKLIGETLARSIKSQYL